MRPDDGTAEGAAFARRMARAVGWCVGTVALLLPLALFWAPFGALVMRLSWWVIPALLVLGGGLIAWDTVVYLRAESHARR